jgi:Predicted N6-adenine-specific DNA methylase
MEKLELIAPCHFGLEAVLKREIQDLGYEIINVEDGRVTFAGDASAICRANVFFADRGESAAEGWKFQSSDV